MDSADSVKEDRTDPIPPRMMVLGVPVSIVNMDTAVKYIVSWAGKKKTRKVFLRDVHGLMKAYEDPQFKDLHSDADLVLPDGMPLTWIGRSRGFGRAIARTPGADVVDQVCLNSLSLGATHYFYGGKPGVAEAMVRNLTAKYPNLKIVGTYSPPFRELPLGDSFSAEQNAEILEIKRLMPDFIWVGISTPKQEVWISEASKILEKGVLFGVGAAFDFHAGLVTRAPQWMSSTGLEWLHRLLSEPKRLWRRYLLVAPKFVFALIAWRR